jgi:3',5'-cyclic AMP phosphodiesterase CpdA
MALQKWLWPEFRHVFTEYLSILHDATGPWDLVTFTGDLVQSGRQEEYELAKNVLGELWERMGHLGSCPQLAPVPGNHDLVLPLLRWHRRLLELHP